MKCLLHCLLVKQIYNCFLNLSYCIHISYTAYIAEHFIDDHRPCCHGCLYSLGRVRHTYACTLPSLRSGDPSHATTLFERTVHSLFIATFVVFSLALTQHNLCHYTRHMFMHSFSYVSPHVTVLSYE